MQSAFKGCQKEVISQLGKFIETIMSSTSSETDQSLKVGYELLFQCLQDELKDTDKVSIIVAKCYTQLIIK